MNSQTLRFINQADRQYLSFLNKRIASGDFHLVGKANEQLVLTGQSTIALNKSN